jgi:hypothetical protein
MNKPRGLGRGLDVLLPTNRPAPAAQPQAERMAAHPNIFCLLYTSDAADDVIEV